jgi:prolyl-tRNA editing enzyme YbaK/EbsC (Cys-tRNA(Pro) deacylase)
MALPAAAQRVQDHLATIDPALTVQEMPDSTRTAEEAAAACGCTVSQIAKSIIFRGKQSGRPILVIASGVNRVDEKKVRDAIGEKPGRADADFVRGKTGFTIGGVPPVAHTEPPIVLIDQDLLVFDQIWAAGGTPRAVFAVAPDRLAGLTGGQVADIRKDS